MRLPTRQPCTGWPSGWSLPPLTSAVFWQQDQMQSRELICLQQRLFASVHGGDATNPIVTDSLETRREPVWVVVEPGERRRVQIVDGGRWDPATARTSIRITEGAPLPAVR